MLTTKLTLPKADLSLLSGACHWAAVYLQAMQLRLHERDRDALIELSYDRRKVRKRPNL
jgi:hypothetical protein